MHAATPFVELHPRRLISSRLLALQRVTAPFEPLRLIRVPTQLQDNEPQRRGGGEIRRRAARAPESNDVSVQSELEPGTSFVLSVRTGALDGVAMLE